MCIDPISMVAMGVSAAGSLYSGYTQSQSYNAQGQYADRQSELAREKGAYEASQQERENTQRLASMRGQYLSSGIALSGSAADVLQDSATQASLDEQAIRYGAEIESDNYKYQANLARSNAKSAMAGGVMGALSSGVNAFTGATNRNTQRTVIRSQYVPNSYYASNVGAG